MKGIRTRWVEVLPVLFILTVIWPSVSTQSFTPDTSFNCSHRYLLNLNPSSHERTNSSCCLGSCVDSTPLISGVVDRCVSIMEILSMYNSSIISEEDCLELVFTPGTYQLSSLASRVRVQYSVIMSAPEGGVVFTCAASQEASCVCGTNNEDADLFPDGRVVPLLMFEGAQQRNRTMFVKFNNIEFKHCSRQLEFIALYSLSVTGCKFV